LCKEEEEEIEEEEEDDEIFVQFCSLLFDSI